jgi:predicted DNA-binding transcriptional regulator AlpA
MSKDTPSYKEQLLDQVTSNPETDFLLPDAIAANLLGTSQNNLKISRCTGKLFGVDAPQFLKIGRTVRYRKSSIDAWSAQFQGQRTTAVAGGCAK